MPNNHAEILHAFGASVIVNGAADDVTEERMPRMSTGGPAATTAKAGGSR